LPHDGAPLRRWPLLSGIDKLRANGTVPESRELQLSGTMPLASSLVDAFENEPAAQRRAVMGQWIRKGQRRRKGTYIANNACVLFGLKLLQQCDSAARRRSGSASRDDNIEHQ
jgi:hypothetical protein